MTEWRTIPSYPMYEASADGQVSRRREFARYATKGNPLKQAKTGGYPSVCLGLGAGKRITVRVHVLVCEAFNGFRPLNHEAAHWDGDRSNPDAGNVRWATSKENKEDRDRHGRTARGEAFGKAKLTEAQVKEIRAIWPLLPRSSSGKRIANGATRSMEKRFGVTRDNLYKLARGIHWRHTL